MNTGWGDHHPNTSRSHGLNALFHILTGGGPAVPLKFLSRAAVLLTFAEQHSSSHDNHLGHE